MREKLEYLLNEELRTRTAIIIMKRVKKTIAIGLNTLWKEKEDFLSLLSALRCNRLPQLSLEGPGVALAVVSRSRSPEHSVLNSKAPLKTRKGLRYVQYQLNTYKLSIR